MQPSRLDNAALKFELDIRGLTFEDGNFQKNARSLRKALREEKIDSFRRPRPILEPMQEAGEILQSFDLLTERTLVPSFKRGKKDFEDVYSQLCQLEGRTTYTNWSTTEANRKLLDSLELVFMSFRNKYFSDRSQFISVKPRISVEEDEEEFTENQEDELKQLERRVQQLKLLKEKKTMRVVSYEQEFDETISDDEHEANEDQIEQNSRRNLREALRGNVNDPSGRGSRSGVVNRPPPPTNPHSDNVPRNSDPFYPNPYSSAQQNAAINSSFYEQGMNQARASNNRRQNSLPVFKWPFHFDGEIIAFIKDVENMAIAQLTSLDELRRGISILLKGKAQDWYRVYGYQFNSWVDIVNGLKEEFLPADFDHRVDAEIRATKQTEIETFQEFCIRIELVFMKLSHPMHESMKVEHLKHNMHRSYKTPDVARLRTIHELREACRYVDSINERGRAAAQRIERPQNFRQVPRVYAMQENLPEEYRQPDANDEGIPLNNAQTSAVEEQQREIQEIQAMTREIRQRQQAGQRDFSLVKCYNCNEFGHFANTCVRPQRTLRCQGCGARGLTRAQCQNCRLQNVPEQNRDDQRNLGNSNQSQ